MKLSDLILISDVDGTLLDHDGGIPHRNLDALRRFTEKGGRFGIATGRTVEFVRQIVKQLPVNMPCVVCNGSALYDFAREEFLMRQYLPLWSRDYLTALMEKFPQVRYFVVTDRCQYDLSSENAYTRNRYNNPFICPGKLSDIGSNWFRIVMFLDPKLVDTVLEYGSQFASELRFVLNDNDMLEINPLNSSKGSVLQALIELEGISPDRLVCIGDYYNDIEMIELAGIGATLETAPEEIKRIAQMIVCRCNDGAVGDLVERLEAIYDG